jgi:hypothetical protein
VLPATTPQVLQKWGLLLASALLSEESIRRRALPQEAIQPLAAGADEALQLLEGLAALAAAVLGRWVALGLCSAVFGLGWAGCSCITC